MNDYAIDNDICFISISSCESKNSLVADKIITPKPISSYKQVKAVIEIVVFKVYLVLLKYISRNVPNLPKQF